MALSDTLKATLYSTRAICGQLGLRPNSVALLTSTYSGEFTGRGDSIGELVPILEGAGQNPKVREISGEELALGSLAKGSLRIGPITPDFAGGGTPIETLRPDLANGQTLHVIVTGPDYPNGAKFLIKDISTDHALHFLMTVSPVSEEGP